MLLKKKKQLFVQKLKPENNINWIFHSVQDKLIVNFFSEALQKYLKDKKTQ